MFYITWIPLQIGVNNEFGSIGKSYGFINLKIGREAKSYHVVERCLSSSCGKIFITWPTLSKKWSYICNLHGLKREKPFIYHRWILKFLLIRPVSLQAKTKGISKFSDSLSVFPLRTKLTYVLSISVLMENQKILT